MFHAPTCSPVGFTIEFSVVSPTGFFVMKDYTNWPLIGQGEERSCYRDPDDPSRMVKFSLSGRSKQTRREIRYFTSLLRKGIPFDFIPRYYGEIREKDRLGIEQEYITDELGSTRPAPTVDAYVSSPLTAEEIDAFRKAYFQLKDWLLRFNVIPANLALGNVVVSKTPSGIRLVMVDGIGGTEWLPLANWFRFFGKRKINRKWAKLSCKLNALNSKLKL